MIPLSSIRSFGGLCCDACSSITELELLMLEADRQRGRGIAGITGSQKESSKAQVA